MPYLVPFRNTIQHWITQTLDVLLPPRCIGTGEIVSTPGTVSAEFWQQLSFIEAPYCSVCGLPFDMPMLAGSLCASCIDHPPRFDQARAAVVYNDASRKLILAFKYGDRLNAVITFIPWLKRAGATLTASADVLVPVPLHKSRLWKRRYNQASILACALAKEILKPCYPDGLLRTRATVPQKGLTKKERYQNVHHAFCVNPKYRQSFQGKTVLLVDDVFTSGATLNECAHALKKSGAAAVHVLTIARVTREAYEGQ